MPRRLPRRREPAGPTWLINPRAQLRASLPEVYGALRVHCSQALPLTANGKIDRKALPAPERSGSDEANIRRLRAHPSRRSLAGIWTEVLGLKQVGIKDNFFELGGHSLLAVSLFARIQHEFGKIISGHAVPIPDGGTAGLCPKRRQGSFFN